MKNLNNITIVIVTYLTNKKILDSCLNSIDKSVKVILVENSKKFREKKYFLNKYKNLTIYCTGKNLGYGGGNNFGINKIKTEFVLILNPDTVLDKYFFVNLNLILNNRSFELVGCDLLENNSYISGGFFDKEKNNELKKIYFSKKRNNFLKVDWITGNSIILNIKRLKTKKVFDENFFLYFEEFDLCQKIKKKDKKIYLSKFLKVHHLGFKSSYMDQPSFKDEAEKLRNWHWMWSYFYYHKKNFGYLYALSSSISKLVKSLFKIIFYLILFDKKNFYKYFFRMWGLVSSILGFKSFFRGRFFN